MDRARAMPTLQPVAKARLVPRGPGAVVIGRLLQSALDVGRGRQRGGIDGQRAGEERPRVAVRDVELPMPCVESEGAGEHLALLVRIAGAAQELVRPWAAVDARVRRVVDGPVPIGKGDAGLDRLHVQLEVAEQNAVPGAESRSAVGPAGVGTHRFDVNLDEVVVAVGQAEVAGNRVLQSHDGAHHGFPLVHARARLALRNVHALVPPKSGSVPNYFNSASIWRALCASGSFGASRRKASRCSLARARSPVLV